MLHDLLVRAEYKPGKPRHSVIPLPAALDRVLEVLVAGALLGELGIVFFNILSRSLLNRPLVWTDEAAELALSMIAFLGGAFAYRRGEHAFIRTVVESLPARSRRACHVLVDYIVLATVVTMGVSAIPSLIARWDEPTPVLQVSASWFVLPLVVSMLVLAISAAERLWGQHPPTVLAVGAVVGALTLLVALTRDAWQAWLGGDAVLALTLGLFFVALVIGLPVGFALLLGALAYLYVSGTAPMVVLAHTMANSNRNFVLLALPFFIFVGMIMNEGGISLRLVRLVQVLVGHFRGGLLQVMVVSVYVISGLSGSKMADIAAVGSVMRDMLRREQYSLEQATAVLAACAAMGETVPPSIAILVLGSVTTLSMGALFLAGIVPAAVVAVCLMTLIYLQARRSPIAPHPHASLRQLVTAALAGVLPLLMPVILLAGILSGMATPTEVSSFAVVYGVVLAGLIYRELGLRTFLKCVSDCAAVSGVVLFILATATAFAWTLTVANLPHRLVALLTGTHQSHWVFLLATIFLLIVTGSILEGLPALLILAPILMPIAAQVGLSQLHYGIVLIIAMGIGGFAPPIGVGFYVACAICETTIEKSARAMVPYFLVLVVGLLVVAFVPWFTLALPVHFHLGR